MIAIAIDGPAGAGKSSVAKALAQRLGCIYLDTGAMYRAVGYKALRKGADPASAAQVLPFLADTLVDVAYEGGQQRIFLDGEDVSDRIRTAEIGMAASAVSAIPQVRERLVEMQRQIAEGKSVVMDGRDIGTVVLPNAEYKFFVTASPRERALRRYRELNQRGILDRTLEQLEEEIVKRDYDDSHREHSPLKQAPDALLVDTTGMGLEEVIEYLLQIIREGRKG